MAKTTVTHITDDIDGSKDAIEVVFSFNGTDYSIDLSKKNLAAFEKAIKPYVDAATKLSASSASPRRAKAPRGSSTRKDLASIRAWAKAEGLQVSDRGRVSAAIVEQYDAANS